MDIPYGFHINDCRRPKNFTQKSFSGYKKINVFQAYEKALLDNKIEEACHWSIEIVVSGYINEFWEKVLHFICKRINIANLRLPTYVLERITIYENLKKYNKIDDFLELRNNQQFRNLVCEITCVLCKSRKMNISSMKRVKIANVNSEMIKKRILATSVLNGNLIKVNDPSEIKITSNELLYNIRNRNITNVLFWLSWMLEWEKINIKKLKFFHCSFRPHENVDNKFANDFIWLIWEIVLQEARRTNFREEIESLYFLFKYKYQKSKKSRRIVILICALEILFHHGNKNKKIIDDYSVVINVSSQINLLYKEKKKFQVISPNKIEEIRTKRRSRRKKLKLSEESQRKLNFVFGNII
tara:strand:+ start:14 stop:1081 length:1068 start_codon:yes stop_codon:yes gene_type:complete